MIGGGYTPLHVPWLTGVTELKQSCFARPSSTGSKAFSIVVCLNATKVVLRSFFALEQTIYPKINTQESTKSTSGWRAFLKKCLCLSSHPMVFHLRQKSNLWLNIQLDGCQHRTVDSTSNFTVINTGLYSWQHRTSNSSSNLTVIDIDHDILLNLVQ